MRLSAISYTSVLWLYYCLTCVQTIIELKRCGFTQPLCWLFSMFYLRKLNSLGHGVEQGIFWFLIQNVIIWIETIYLCISKTCWDLNYLLWFMFSNDNNFSKTTLLSCFLWLWLWYWNVIPWLVFRCFNPIFGVLQIGIRAMVIENQV